MEWKSFLRQLTDALTRPSFAYDVLRKRRRNTFGLSSKEPVSYLVTLTLLLSVLSLIAMLVFVYPMGTLEAALNQIDGIEGDISLKEGELDVSLAEPFVYHTGLNLLIIDMDLRMADGEPDGEILLAYSGYPGAILYLGSDVMVSQYGAQRVPLLYSDLHVTFDYHKADVLAAIRGNAWWVILLANAAFFGGKLLASLFFAWVIALLSAGIGLFTKRGLEFSELYALALYALTAIVLLEGLLYCVGLLAGSVLGLPWYVGWVVTLAYMTLYLRSIKRQEAEPGAQWVEDF